MYFYKSPTCKSQVPNTSRMSLVNTLSKTSEKQIVVSSSREKELDELLRRQIIRPPGKFEERRLFEVQKAKGISREVSSPCLRLRPSFGIIRPAFGTERDVTEQ